MIHPPEASGRFEEELFPGQHLANLLELASDYFRKNFSQWHEDANSLAVDAIRRGYSNEVVAAFEKFVREIGTPSLDLRLNETRIQYYNFWYYLNLYLLVEQVLTKYQDIDLEDNPESNELIAEGDVTLINDVRRNMSQESRGEIDEMIRSGEFRKLFLRILESLHSDSSSAGTVMAHGHALYLLDLYQTESDQVDILDEL